MLGTGATRTSVASVYSLWLRETTGPFAAIRGTGVRITRSPGAHLLRGTDSAIVFLVQEKFYLQQHNSKNRAVTFGERKGSDDENTILLVCHSRTDDHVELDHGDVGTTGMVSECPSD